MRREVGLGVLRIGDLKKCKYQVWKGQDLFRKIEKRDYLLRHVCLSVRLSSWNNSAATGQLFVKFGIEDFSKVRREISGFIKI
jgi:hypothetical protein